MTSLWGCYFPHFASDGSRKWLAPGHRGGAQVPASLTPKALFFKTSHLSRKVLEPFSLWTLYEFPRAAITKYASLSSLDDRHFLIVRESGSPKSRCWQGCFPLRLISLVCSHLSSSWVPTESSLCASLCPDLLYLQGQQSDSGPSYQPHFNLITFLKALLPNLVTSWGGGCFEENIVQLLTGLFLNRICVSCKERS